jgi:hypothetical protein
MTQQEAVLNHLKTVGHITQLEALDLFGCFRLASVINKLRELFNIDTEIVCVGKKRFAKYIYMEE